MADIVSNVAYVVKGVELNQPRLLQRAIRQNVTIRRYITANQLRDMVEKKSSGSY